MEFRQPQDLEAVGCKMDATLAVVEAALRYLSDGFPEDKNPSEVTDGCAMIVRAVRHETYNALADHELQRSRERGAA